MKITPRIAAAAVGLVLAVAPAAVASGGSSCDLVASPSGDDLASGLVSAPFRSVQRLVDALAPGQTGCLRAGVYQGDVRVGVGGGPGARVTLTSFPGETATVVGRFWIARGADYVTVEGLHLDGSNGDRLPSPTINANDATFSYDDVTNGHTAICFDVGSEDYGTAAGTLITHDRIHGCGRLPAGNHDHGIYVAAATGTTIEWNLIYANADRGVQLYPDAQHTTIDHNVIDGNGEGIIFSGDDGFASSGANVFDNLITNSVIRHDVESWYPAGNPVGVANVVHQNCVWGGKEGAIDTSGGGFTASGNIVANPEYVDAAAHDYRLQSTSPCVAITGDIAAAVDGATPTAQTAQRVRTRHPARRSHRHHRHHKHHKHKRRGRERRAKRHHRRA